MLISEIKTILEAAQLAHNYLIDTSNFVPINVESKALIERLQVIMAQNYDEHTLAREIETLLANHWALVRNSCLSYTALPNHYLTSCCVNLAKALHSNDPTKTDLNYLMPGITKPWQPAMVTKKNNSLFVLESKEAHEDIPNLNLEDFPLDQIIVSADRNKIIPIKTLRQLPYYSLHWHMQHDTDLQSHDTLERLKHHSKEERYWLDAYYELEAAYNSNITFKDALQQLAIDLKEGATYAEGDELLAGTTAFVGVARFMRIFNRLSLEQQTILLQLNDGTQNSLKKIIHTLVKGGSQGDIDTCVHEIYQKIEKILRYHSHNEFLTTKPSLDINASEKNFSKFKLKGKQSIESGSDNFLNYPTESIKKIIDNHIHSVNDLDNFFAEIGTSLQSYSLSFSIGLFKAPILKHINNYIDIVMSNNKRVNEIIYTILFIEKPQILTASTFSTYFKLVSEKNRLLFLRNYQSHWLNYLKQITPINFRNLIIDLNEDEIQIIFEQYIKLHNPVNFNVEYIYYFLEKLTKKQREYVFDNFIKNRINELIFSSTDLFYLLPHLTEEQKDLVYEETKEKFSVFIEDKNQTFFSILEYLNESQRKEIFDIFFNKKITVSDKNLNYLLKYLPIQDYPKLFNREVISNLNELLCARSWYSIIANLNKEQLITFTQLVNNKNSNYIKHSLDSMLSKLPEEQCQWYLDGLRDTLPTIIRNLDDLRNILNDFSAHKVGLLFEALGEHLFTLVPNYQSLTQLLFFSDNSQNYHSDCCDTFKDKLQGIEQIKELFNLKRNLRMKYINIDEFIKNYLIELDSKFDLDKIKKDLSICKNIFNFACKFIDKTDDSIPIFIMDFCSQTLEMVLTNNDSYEILEKKIKKLIGEYQQQIAESQTVNPFILDNLELFLMNKISWFLIQTPNIEELAEFICSENDVELLKKLILHSAQNLSKEQSYLLLQKIQEKLLINTGLNVNVEKLKDDLKIYINIINFCDKFDSGNSTEQLLTDIKQFREETFKAVRTNNEPYPVLEKQLKKIARNNFEHQDYGKRITADILQFITGLFIIIMPIKLLKGEHVLFSKDKTNCQKKFEKEVLFDRPGEALAR